MQASKLSSNIRRAVGLLHDDESGQDLIEYVLIAAMLGIGAVGIMGNLAADVLTAFQDLSQALLFFRCPCSDVLFF